MAKYLSGESEADKEKKRLDLALEKYEKEYQKYQENRTKLIDWIASNEKIKDEAKQNFENTDIALKLYNETHQDQIDLNEPQFSDFYKPSVQQKRGELIYVGASALAIGLAASHFLLKKMSDKTLSKIYYGPRGFWKGLEAVKKLAQEAGVSADVAKLWLMKHAIWQIYLPFPRVIPRPKFDVSFPNSVHQADLLFLPHDRLPRGRKIYKYALTVVDVASRFKAAEPLSSKESSEVTRAFQRIYKGPLKWPSILQVDPGREFMGEMRKEMVRHDVRIRTGNVDVHRDQGIVERFNRTLSERLVSFQYSQEMNMKSSERSRELVKRLPEVVRALNNEVTRSTGKRPVDAIRERAVNARSSVRSSRPVGLRSD